MPADDDFAAARHSATVYGQSGALKDFVSLINDPGIRSIEDVIQFTKNYPGDRQKKIEESIANVKTHLSELAIDLIKKKDEQDIVLKAKTDELNQILEAFERKQGLPPERGHFLAGAFKEFKAWVGKLKVRYIRKNFQKIVKKAAKKQTGSIAKLEVEISRIEADVEGEAKARISAFLRAIDSVDYKLREGQALYHGAIGERDVIQRLGQLPGTYHVINDFRDKFREPIYNRAENDRIYSIQVDHIVVGPTGVFVIETKNWSEQTLSSDAHFSPIKQVRRAGFALFVLLNQAAKRGRIRQSHAGWGTKKISLKQVVVFRNRVPQGQYQFVKVLGIDKLNSYIMFGSPIYQPEDVNEIVSYLLRSNQG